MGALSCHIDFSVEYIALIGIACICQQLLIKNVSISSVAAFYLTKKSKVNELINNKSPTYGS